MVGTWLVITCHNQLSNSCNQIVNSIKFQFLDFPAARYLVFCAVPGNPGFFSPMLAAGCVFRQGGG
jgi:hypothetical protein